MVFRRAITFFFVYFGWVIFAAKDLSDLVRTVSHMISFRAGGLEPTLVVLRNSMPLLALGVLFSIPGPVWMEKLRCRKKAETVNTCKAFVLMQTLLLILILGLCTVVLMGTAAKPSMYAGF